MYKMRWSIAVMKKKVTKQKKNYNKGLFVYRCNTSLLGIFIQEVAPLLEWEHQELHRTRVLLSLADATEVVQGN